MKSHTYQAYRLSMMPGISLLFASLILFASCRKQVEKEIAGQAFTNHPKTGVVKQPGALIRFLTEQQNEQFKQLVGLWRTNKLAALEKAQKDYAQITNQITRLGITRAVSYQNISTLQPYTNRLAQSPDDIRTLISLYREDPSLLKNLEVAEVYYEFVLHEVCLDADKINTRMPPLDDESIKNLLKESTAVTTDADGNFAVVLGIGREYWILAETQKPPHRKWYFRYVPDGTRLILSDGNAD